MVKNNKLNTILSSSKTGESVGNAKQTIFLFLALQCKFKPYKLNKFIIYTEFHSQRNSLFEL